MWVAVLPDDHRRHDERLPGVEAAMSLSPMLVAPRNCVFLWRARAEPPFGAATEVSG
jgi:hypothetical protein